MSDETRRETPLVRIPEAGGTTAFSPAAGVSLSERAFLGHVDLRTRDGVVQAGEALGFSLPEEPLTSSATSEPKALWLGPDEWLIITAPDAQAGVIDALAAALAGKHHAVTDLSGGQTVIRVSGDNARALLARGTMEDLHPRNFTPGRCINTHIARTMAIIHQVDDTPAFDLVVRRSFADYLWRWLVQAAGNAGFGPTERTD